MKIDGQATVYEVIAVVHSASGDGAEIYVKHVGDLSDAVKHLLENLA
jgi:hypothetical protein